MEVKDRIKSFRKELNLNQTEFAQKLGILQRTYSNYENGSSPIPDHLLVSISAIYGVSETWLASGEGPMRNDVTTDDEISYFLGEVMGSDDSDIRKRLVSALARTSPEDWEAFSRFLDRLIETHGTKKEDKD